METIFVTESRELLFTGTEDIDVRPLHSPVLHYEGDSREVALRAAHEAAAASKVEACQRGFARWVATVSEITLDGEGPMESEETVNTVDPLDRVPELRKLAGRRVDFTCYRVGRAPYNGTLYLPAGFHDYGIATLRGLFAALEGGQCEFLCEYQDEIDGVYHGLFEKKI